MLEWKFLEKHPIEGKTKRVDVALAGVWLFEDELRG